MVSKNTTGDASASSDQIATDPSRHGRVPVSPLDYFGVEDEVVIHPNRLLDERDELEDMRTPDTVYDWLVSCTLGGQLYDQRSAARSEVSCATRGQLHNQRSAA